MTNMQRLVLVLAIVFAVLLGVLVATTFLGGGSGSPGPTATPAAIATPTGSAPPASPPQSALPSSSAVPSASASPSASPSAKPSPTPVPIAKIAFMSLKLDAGSDAAGADRVITWTGLVGPVTVQLSSTTPSGNAKMCLSADGKALGCRTASGGELTARVTKGTGNFKLTLRGAAAATPVVNVTISFPAVKPKVAITGARFDGTSTPETNGLQVVMTPRAKGSVHVSANWGGHPFVYEVDLIEQGGPGTKSLTNQGPATRVSQGFAVTPPNGWMVVVQNTESGFGPTPMNATYTWP